ncbi:cytochrome c oxidase subunit II [Acuticoccus sp. I52.16.1]|uniref:cytochrome c oxidase subunit II n=1 Tax=Acuticoccus sp. I52.16.1 TaxID=2928472 RepID=UPI001FD235B1|nr:cytochrome ubiquinol oxidase subunit II [Acuticoccus sp. I52.16.1]UOM32746.1 cytochrome ubiquinol oxidase subunit II [Acuticoccus sp. I52.16.1]
MPVLIVAGLAAGLLAGPAVAGESFLVPLGEIAARQRNHFYIATLIILLPILPVLLLTPFVMWFYRRREGSVRAYTPNWEFNRWLEVAMWGVPILVVVALATALIVATQRLNPYDRLGPDPLQVDVIGLDWKWLFIYPEQQVASVGEFVVPAGRPVTLRITTDTVMQSFWIPALAGQIYAMPGMRTELNMRATEPGETRGQNSQYSGDGFPHQRFTVRALPEGGFDAWVDAARTLGTPLEAATYTTLSKPSILSDMRGDLGLEGEGPVNFRLRTSGLFDCVMARYHSGEAVTPQLQPGSPTFDAAAAGAGAPDAATCTPHRAGAHAMHSDTHDG